MTVRNFWTIFLKALGIWLVINGLTAITQYLASVFNIALYAADDPWSVFYSVLLTSITLGLYALILWLFVFNTQWLIDKLQLEKGFDEQKLESNFDYSKILTVSIIVIGGLMFVDSLPMFCQQTFNYFQQKQMLQEGFNSGWLFFYLAKTVIAYLMMTNSRALVKYIEQQFRPKEAYNEREESQ